ncbi:MAG: multidrug ABC transporter ATPase/permease [Bacillota bacterium]|nr:MAG: multidrug ABC transporter ATPase/permease [Bacillota bacterium]
MTVVSETGIQVALALLLKGLVNASVTADSHLLLSSVGRYGAVILLMACLLPVASRLTVRAAERAIQQWRQNLFDHLQKLPLTYFEANHSQEIVSRLTNDINVSKQFLSEELIEFLSQVVSAIVSATFIVLIDWRFMAVPLFIVATSIILNHYAAAPLQRLSRYVQDGLARLNARFKDMVDGLTVARAYNFSHVLVSRFSEESEEYRERSIRLTGLQSCVSATNNLLGAANFLAVVALGSYMLLHQELTPGEVVAVVQFSQVMVRPFRMVGGLWSSLQQTLAASARIMEVLDATPERIVSRGLSTSDGGAVSFKNVSFSYGEVAALNGVSFQAPIGSTIAFVGESGGGKSTIFKLLLGFYPVDHGIIGVCGRDIGEYSLPELRGMVALVPQDAYLYSGTIYDNISCGRDDVSEEAVIAAAKAANAHEFISSFVQGYRTEVGERGALLSGGQRQRIAIARALLKDAPILLLDEATSNIDNESEHLVWEALRRLMEGRTTLLIAHRLSTARQADMIFVVAGGRIVEQGTHEELLSAGGHYRRLCEASGEDSSGHKKSLFAYVAEGIRV